MTLAKLLRCLPISLALIIAAVSGAEQQGTEARRRNTASTDACSVKRLEKSNTQGLKVYAPDGRRFLINKKDEAGVAQVYIGEGDSSDLSCITCDERPNGPKRKRFKMQPHWHPSGKWIFLAAEREKYSPPPLIGLSKSYVEGQLQNGIFTNMYAVTVDGKDWYRLTDFKSNAKGVADGFTGVAFTPDGRKAVWSQAMDGNIFKYHPFGRWQLMLADFEEENGVPGFTNIKDITPKGMFWNEPGNFHPDNESLLLTGSDQKDAQGMDLYIMNIRTRELKNLTNSPTVWDEHGVFSPDGQRVLFMTAYPYRDNPKASKVLSIKTEFMIMNSDGSNWIQLTRFREPGSPEYSDGIAAVGEFTPDGRSANLTQLFFPNYQYWDLTFEGPCGNSGRARPRR